MDRSPLDATATSSSNSVAATIPAFHPFDPMPGGPFPAELRCVAPRNVAHRTMDTNRRQLARAKAAASAPIPLPESHIQRTRSELRLEALEHRAELDDILMYSRLLGGMLNQLCSRCIVYGGDQINMHPLTMKSVRGIVKTRLASGEGPELQEQDRRSADVADCEWDILYIPIVGGLFAEALLSGRGSEVSSPNLAIPDAEVYAHEDDCVFGMEL